MIRSVPIGPPMLCMSTIAWGELKDLDFPLLSRRLVCSGEFKGFPTIITASALKRMGCQGHLIDNRFLLGVILTNFLFSSNTLHQSSSSSTSSSALMMKKVRCVSFAAILKQKKWSILRSCLMQKEGLIKTSIQLLFT